MYVFIWLVCLTLYALLNTAEDFTAVKIGGVGGAYCIIQTQITLPLSNNKRTIAVKA